MTDVVIMFQGSFGEVGWGGLCNTTDHTACPQAEASEYCLVCQSDWHDMMQDQVACND